MEYRYLGKSGLQVSVLSFGSWLTFGKQVKDGVAQKCMKLAYDSGINFFDNAEIYARGESEKVMGSILKKMNWSRDTFLVSSKVFWGGELPNQKGLSRKHITEACHAALKRLQVEYLDMYFCHRPDLNTPIAETVWTMHNLIQQGKILYWGTSEWSAQEIQEAIGFAEKNHLIAPVVEQPQYNMFHRKRFEVEYFKLFRDHGMGSTIWSPLASGILSGKHNDKFVKNTRLGMEGMEWLKEKNFSEEKINKVVQLTGIAHELGISMAQLAIVWAINNPNVSTAILGASKPEQLEENIAALDCQKLLDDSILKRIETILDNKEEITVF